MAAKSLHCRLITPVAKVLDEDVTHAMVPAWDGQFGVLPDHAPLVAKLGVGELRLDFPDRDGARGGSRAFVIQDGFVQVVQNRLTILASKAVPVESIDAAAAQEELRQVESRKVEEAGPVRGPAHERRDKDLAFARAKVRAAQGATGRI